MSYQSSLLPLYRRRRAVGGFSPFSPFSLFANGEQGVWYQNSDFSTLFQDAAGTTPVTALEQPVGLRLDKSKQQSFATRKNLFAQTEQIIGAPWERFGGATFTGTNVAAAPDATITADSIRLTTSGTGSNVYQSFTAAQTSANTYTLSIWVKRNAATDQTFQLFQNIRGATPYGLSGDLTATSEWQRFTFTHTETGGSTGSVFGVIGNTTGTQSDLLVWGAQLEVGSSATTYQAVTTLPTSWLGSHASQATSASRPVLSARYNLLTYTEQFDNAIWNKAALNTTGTPSWVNVATAPDGTQTAEKMIENTASAQHYISRTATVVSGETHTLLVHLKAGERTWAFIEFYGGIPAGTIYINLSTGAKGTTTGSASAVTVTDSGNGWWRVALPSFVASSTSAAFAVYTSTGNAVNSYLGDGTSGIYIWGADLRVSNDGVGLPSYQRVGAATYGTSTVAGNPDYDTVGFPPYLIYDGGDWMVTPSINFTGTDKMSVFAGVRRLAGTAGQYQLLAELGPTVNLTDGSWAVFPVTNVTDRFGFGLRGTVAAGIDPQSYPIPSTNILSVQYSISAASVLEEIIPRIDAIVNQSNPVNANAGTGNFGNYPLYIGARAGTSLFYTGRDYGFVIVGRAVTATELTNTEDYMDVQTFGKNMTLVYSDELTTALGELITAADGDQIYMTVQYV